MVIAVLVVFLTGWQPKPEPEPIIIQPIVIPYHPLGLDLESLMGDIHDAGIQVIHQGDTLRMIYPIDQFFRMPTTELKPNKIFAVKESVRFVRAYIRLYGHSPIDVLGFSDKVYSRPMRIETSEQYALVIAAYLWHSGIPRSRIHVQGLAATQAVATYRTPEGN